MYLWLVASVAWHDMLRASSKAFFGLFLLSVPPHPPCRRPRRESYFNNGRASGYNMPV